MHMRARNIATRRSLEAGSKMQTETDLVRATSHETNRAQLLCRPLNTSNHQQRPASSTIEQCKSAAPRGAQGAVLELSMSARPEDVFRSARVLRLTRLLQSWHEPAAAAPPRFARRAAAASAFYTEPQRATPPLALRLAGRAGLACILRCACEGTEGAPARAVEAALTRNARPATGASRWQAAEHGGWRRTGAPGRAGTDPRSQGERLGSAAAAASGGGRARPVRCAGRTRLGPAGAASPARDPGVCRLPAPPSPLGRASSPQSRRH